MKTHRCYVPDITGARATLPETEAHHVRHVLRLEPGDDLIVFDRQGREWLARIVAAGRRDVTVDLLEPRTPVAEPPVAMTLVVGLLKGDQMSNVVRDATALGVSRIVPCVSSHVALPAAARLTGARERLTRIATSSAAQCGRAVVPMVAEVARFEDVLADPGAGLRIICVEPALDVEPAPWPGSTPRPDVATLFVGPEGGWSDREALLAREAGALTLSLGPRTLRAELAPTVALAVLWARWGWVGG
ncbi:MAG: 16S rRNA (uracil(1498)-N(3))-methyltransferase [Acidobacteria bacterium]|nr:16S rRNA (uracil(1498)-N(3))-methyltransferase [Acidobacteriota bacterium]